MTRFAPLLALCISTAAAAEPSVAPPITAVTIAPGGRHLVAGSQSGCQVYSWPELKRERSLEISLGHVHDLAFSPDGETLAVAGGTPAESGSVELIRWSAGERIGQTHAHEDLVYGVDWNTDSSQLIVASMDCRAAICDASGKVGRMLEGHSRGVMSAVFLPGDAGLVTAGVDESLRVWDAGGRLLRTLSNHTRPVYDLAVRPSGGSGPPMLVSVSADRTVRLWQPTVGRLVRFVRLDSVPLAVAWLPGGTGIAVACRDGHVRVIDPETVAIRTDIAALEGAAYSLAVAPDGSAAVGGEGGQLRRLVLRQTAPSVP